MSRDFTDVSYRRVCVSLVLPVWKGFCNVLVVTYQGCLQITVVICPVGCSFITCLGSCMSDRYHVSGGCAGCEYNLCVAMTP